MARPTVTTQQQFHGIFRYDSTVLTQANAVGKRLYDSLPAAQNALGKMRLSLPKYMSGVLAIRSVQVVVPPQAVHKLTPVTIVNPPSSPVPPTPTVNELATLLLTDLENLTWDQFDAMMY